MPARAPATPRPSWLSAWAGAALALGVSGCGEPPAYEVRWKLVDEAGLADPDAAAELSSVKQCADVGVSRVRVTTRRSDNTVADRQEYPCFPSAFAGGGAVEVPALPAGEYKVEVAGLRRIGEPWDCVDDEATPEVEACVAFAEASVTVAEGSLPTVEVVLLQPPECDDGIDNDRDGLVDGRDPACLIDPTGPESADSSVTLFQLSVTFLDSAAVGPANVSVDALELTVDGEPLATVSAADLDTSQWPFRLPLVTERFEPGNHLFSIVAVDGQGQPRTQAIELEFNVSDDSAGFVLQQFDFDGGQFVEPIVEPIAATIALLLDPGDVTGPTCTLGGSLGGATVSIEQTWLRVTDEDGQPLAAATLQLAGSSAGGSIAPVDEAGGWISFACPTSSIGSAPLAWGSYGVEIEARIGAAVCFANEGVEPLTPQGQAGAQVFYLDRILDEQGAPPTGCEECAVDSDCSGQVCDLGICKDKQP
jgi:hypothetical protein